MHYLAKLLVRAETAEEALESAYEDADTLVERGEFDWFDFNGRWGKSEAHKVDSEEGKKLIKEGMDIHRKNFDDAIRHVRYMLENYTEDQIYNEDFGDYRDNLPKGIYHLSKYMFSQADDSGPGAYLYAVDGDVWGGVVKNQGDLDIILKKDNLWVVPVDFHY